MKKAPPMLIKEAKEIAGSLGKPSKMPGTSFGISAEKCITGSKLALIEGSTCYNCYALRGHYQQTSVKKAHAKRYAGLMHPRWVDAMVRMLRNKHALDKPREVKLSRHHRWHDSGDVQSTAHLANICAVAAATPELAHWLPMREAGILKAFIKAGGIVPDNLIIRLSDTKIDAEPARRFWPHTSGVHNKATPPIEEVCVAPLHNNTCGPCRKCWDKSIPHVSYHQH